MRMLLRLAIASLLVAAGVVVSAWFWVHQPLSLNRATVELSIEPGSTAKDIAQAWVNAGVQTSPRLLYEWFRWSGKARSIRAGSYELHSPTSPQQLLDKMVRGDEVLEFVRLIDGWTFRQFRAALAKAPALKPTIESMSDAQIMAALGEPNMSPEGRFFPDTYAYSRGVSDLTVMRRAYASMQSKLSEAWAQRASDLPLKSPDEALILASIVEKETGRSADRTMVAAVFVNRLRIGMPLQTDPTVIYGLGEAFDGNLRRRDLLSDGPYNTYLRNGLPPTPIAMPSLASLRASLHPADSKALYFVARGDGSSAFSESLAEHNRAVNKYQRGIQ